RLHQDAVWPRRPIHDARDRARQGPAAIAEANSTQARPLWMKVDYPPRGAPRLRHEVARGWIRAAPASAGAKPGPERLQRLHEGALGDLGDGDARAVDLDLHAVVGRSEQHPNQDRLAGLVAALVGDSRHDPAIEVGLRQGRTQGEAAERGL